MSLLRCWIEPAASGLFIVCLTKSCPLPAKCLEEWNKLVVSHAFS